MCGILGFVGNVAEGKWTETLEIIEALFLASESRGRHATGFAALTSPYKHPTDVHVVTDKQPMKASRFITESKAWRSLRHRRCSIVLGHVRYATHGDPRYSENNHPHVSDCGNTFLVHNGVLHDHEDIARKHGLRLRGECDSEILLRIVESHDGPEEGLQACLEECSGSMAIAVMDRIRQSIHLARNGGRSLWLCKLKGQRWLFASTVEIIFAALRNVYGQSGSTNLEMLFPLAEHCPHVLTPQGLLIGGV